MDMIKKIYLNKMAQKMLFGYLEGVDWHIDLCVSNPNPKRSPADDYILMTEKEQNRIYDKVIDCINNYKNKYNGKFSEIEIDDEIAFYLSSNADCQADLINSEVLSEENVEEIFEEYWCYKSNKQKTRIKANKENLYKEYKLAQKQLIKLSKLHA